MDEYDSRGGSGERIAGHDQDVSAPPLPEKVCLLPLLIFSGQIGSVHCFCLIFMFFLLLILILILRGCVVEQNCDMIYLLNINENYELVLTGQ